MFKSLFGPTRAEVWEELARAIDAKVVAGTLSTKPSVTMTVNDWKIVLETFTEEDNMEDGTRIRAPFWNPRQIQFALRKSHFLSDAMTRFFKTQDIMVGDPLFDAHFIVRGNDENIVRQIFQNDEISRHLLALKAGVFLIRDEVKEWKGQYPKEVDVLEFRVNGGLTDLDELKRLFHLFRVTLMELYRLNHPQHPPLAPEESPRLEALRNTLERELNWFAPTVERRGDGLEAPVTLVLGGELSGVLNFSAPHYPGLTVDVFLRATLPSPLPSLVLHTLRGAADRLQNLTDDKIGVELLDKRLVIHGEAKRYRPMADNLLALLKLSPFVACYIEGPSLYINASGLSQNDAANVATLFQKLWRNAAEISLSVDTKALPPSKTL